MGECELDLSSIEQGTLLRADPPSKVSCQMSNRLKISESNSEPDHVSRPNPYYGNRISRRTGNTWRAFVNTVMSRRISLKI